MRLVSILFALILGISIIAIPQMMRMHLAISKLLEVPMEMMSLNCKQGYNT